jgi:hypothetical protein
MVFVVSSKHVFCPPLVHSVSEPAENAGEAFAGGGIGVVRLRAASNVPVAPIPLFTVMV